MCPVLVPRMYRSHVWDRGGLCGGRIRGGRPGTTVSNCNLGDQPPGPHLRRWSHECTVRRECPHSSPCTLFSRALLGMYIGLVTTALRGLRSVGLGSGRALTLLGHLRARPPSRPRPRSRITLIPTALTTALTLTQPYTHSRIALSPSHTVSPHLTRHSPSHNPHPHITLAHSALTLTLA